MGHHPPRWCVVCMADGHVAGQGSHESSSFLAQTCMVPISSDCSAVQQGAWQGGRKGRASKARAGPKNDGWSPNS